MGGHDPLDVEQADVEQADVEQGTVLEELRRLPICDAIQQCSPGGLTAMARLGTMEDAAAGATVFAVGGRADVVRFVLSGRVALQFEDGPDRKMTVGTASAGDLLGWSALRSGDPTWTLTAHATKATRFLVFPGAALRELCEQEREFGYCLMRYVFEAVAGRLADARLQLVDVYGSRSGAER